MQKRRHWRSRILLRSGRLERPGLQLNRSRLRRTLCSCAGLTAAASVLRGTACRTAMTRPSLRRSLAGRRRLVRRGLWRSRSCLLCRACRRTGRRGPGSCPLRRAMGMSCLWKGRSCLAGTACSWTVPCCFGTCLRCSLSNTFLGRSLKYTLFVRSCRMSLPIYAILANFVPLIGSHVHCQSRRTFRLELLASIPDAAHYLKARKRRLV